MPLLVSISSFGSLSTETKADSTVNVYIERQNDSPRADEAIAEYLVHNPIDFSFQFHPKGGQLWIENVNPKTKNANLGSKIPISPADIQENPAALYVLSRSEGKFNPVVNVEYLISINIADLQTQTLRQMSIPASYDAALWTTSYITHQAPYGFVLIQALNAYN